MFSLNGPLWRIFNFIGDVFVMHVLWLVFSLPLVTVGASTTALYYAAMKRIRTDEGTVFSNFMSSFKENFKQASIYWLLLVLFGALMWLDLNFTSTMGGPAATVMMIACSMFLIPYWLVLLYIFPVLAKFNAGVFQNFKNALFLAIRHFPYTLLLTLVWATVWLLLAIFPPFTGLMIISGAGVMATVTSPVYIQLFRVYLPNEMQDDLKRTGQGLFRYFEEK